MTGWAVSSSILLAGLIALRALFKGKISPKLQYAVWGLALLRLLLPVSLFFLPVAAPAEPAEKVLPGQSSAVLSGANIPAYQEQGSDAAPPSSYEIDPDAVESDAEDIPPAQSFAPDLEFAFHAVWVVGAAAAGCWFLGVNARFALRLKQTRRPFAASNCPLPVYVTDAVTSPCLFGLFRPSVYLTEKAAAMGKGLDHVLAHEYCHYRQKDHVWSALRGLCVALWWWNPLLWAGAFLSKTDSELACDDRVIRRIGEEHRLEYGKTLIDLIAEKGAASPLCASTGLCTGAGELKERVQRISNRPKRKTGIAVLAMALALLCAGCAFIGTRPPQEDYNLLITIDCDEPVYDILWEAEASGGGTRNADNTPFSKGEVVGLSMKGSMEYTLQALGEGGKVLAEATFADDFTEDTVVRIVLTEDLRFAREGEDGGALGSPVCSVS